MTNLTQDQITTGSRAIAEYDDKYTTDKEKWIGAEIELVSEYKYHTSFDWQNNVWSKVVKEMNDQSRLLDGKEKEFIEVFEIENTYYRAIDTGDTALGFLTLVKAVELVNKK